LQDNLTTQITAALVQSFAMGQTLKRNDVIGRWPPFGS
jgi:hypothetical protein